MEEEQLRKRIPADGSIIVERTAGVGSYYLQVLEKTMFKIQFFV